MIELDYIFLEKAEENLAAAESEFANRRYNSCASRCYYACFQAAIYALAGAGIRPAGRAGDWGHDFVQAQFNGQLINRRKVYSPSLRNTLAENYAVRETADYKRDHVTEIKARRALRRTDEFVEAVRSGGGETT
jgi:uncharacterized protein (UPF0332 family)